MDTIKNLLSGNSQSTDEQQKPRNVSGKLSGEGSHFPEDHTSHMPGSFEEDPLVEAKVGTGITSAIPSTSTANTQTGQTAQSTTAAKGQGITSSIAEAEAAAAAAYHPSHSSQNTQSSLPTSTSGYTGSHLANKQSASDDYSTASGYTSSQLADKPTATGEYAGTSVAGVQGQSVPHTAQTTSLAHQTSSALSQERGSPTATSQTGQYRGSQAPGVSGVSVVQPSTTTSSTDSKPAAVYGASSGQPLASGEYRGDEAPGVSGQSIPHAAKTTSALPSGAAAAVYAANDKPSTHHTAQTTTLPDRSVTSGASGTSAVVGGTFTERSYALSGGDSHGAHPEHTAHGSHTTATANRLDPHVDSFGSAAATGTSHSTSGATAPTATKVSQPVPSDPISTAPLTSAQDSSHHYGRDAALAGTAAGLGASASTHKDQPTTRDSGIGRVSDDSAAWKGTHSERPGTTVGEHNPHGNDPHAVNRNFQDRVGGGDVVEEAREPTDSKSHFGQKAAAGAGVAGAAGLASHEMRQHQHQSTGADQTLTGSNQPLSDATHPSTGVHQPLTSSGSKSYGNNPLIIGGTAAAGTHAGYGSNQPSSDTPAAGTQAGYGANQPLSGVAQSSTGIQQTSNLSSVHQPMTSSSANQATASTGVHQSSTSGTSKDYGSNPLIIGGTAAAGTHASYLSKENKPNAATESYGTQYKHLADGTPSGIASSDPAYSSSGMTSTAPSTSQGAKHHYGRDAAVAGGAAGGAGLAAHQLGQNKPTHATSSETYGTQYNHLAGGTESGISTKDAGHPATGSLTSTSKPATTQHSQSHSDRNAALAGGVGGGLGGAALSDASKRDTAAATQHTMTTGTGHVPKGYPFDSDKIERAADEGHGRVHHPAEGEEKKHGFLDKLLHRDHPNKLHKEPDHGEGAKTTHEAYDQGHSSSH